MIGFAPELNAKGDNRPVKFRSHGRGGQSENRIGQTAASIEQMESQQGKPDDFIA